MSSKVKILDEITGERIEAMEIVLLHKFSDSFLPEIMYVFGEEHFLKFLDVFSGAKFTVPDRRDIESAARDVDIYIRLKKKDAPDIVANLAVKYDLDRNSVRRIFNEVSSNIDEFKSVLVK